MDKNSKVVDRNHGDREGDDFDSETAYERTRKLKTRSNQICSFLLAFLHGKIGWDAKKNQHAENSI